MCTILTNIRKESIKFICNDLGIYDNDSISLYFSDWLSIIMTGTDNNRVNNLPGFIYIAYGFIDVIKII